MAVIKAWHCKFKPDRPQDGRIMVWLWTGGAWWYCLWDGRWFQKKSTKSFIEISTALPNERWFTLDNYTSALWEAKRREYFALTMGNEIPTRNPKDWERIRERQ